MALEAGSVYAVLGGKFMPTGFAQFDAAMKKSTASAAAAEAQIGRSSGRSAAAMTALGTAAKTGAAAGLIAVGAAAVASVKSAQKFEKQLSELKAVTRASAADMATMRKAALDLGTSTGVGAGEATKALTELAKGGLSSEKAIGALKGTIAMAQAGGMDMAEAGETVANALNLFKLRGEDATMVADSFANAANATTADIKFFSQGMAQGGAAAKAAGLDFSQTTVFLEAMAANGFKSGSDAGTSMKTALIQLANPTKRAQEAAKALGVSFFDQQGQIRPLPALAKDLGNAFDGMSKKEKLATATRLVGTDGMRALLALADQGPAKLKAFADANSETGSAARVAAEKMNNLDGSMKKLNASFEALKIEAGSALTPSLKSAADALTAIFQQMRAGEGVAGKIAQAFKVLGSIRPLADMQKMSEMGGFGNGLAESIRSKFTPAILSALGAIRAVIAAISVAAGIGGKLNPFRGMKPAADAALGQIDKITSGLRKIENRKQTIKVIADTQEAKRQLQLLNDGPDTKGSLKRRVIKILADDTDATTKMKRLTALNIPKKLARILTNAGSVQQAIENLRQKIASLQNKDVTITVTRREVVVGGGRGGRALGGGYAPGRSAGMAETALVGEGGGPEYVVNARTGQSMRVDGPTVMGLSPYDYVIPTESKYRGRAMGLIAQMAADMGLVGYDRGRGAKASGNKKPTKKKPNAEELAAARQAKQLKAYSRHTLGWYDSEISKEQGKADNKKNGKLTAGAYKARRRLRELRAQRTLASDYQAKIDRATTEADIQSTVMDRLVKESPFNREAFNAAVGSRGTQIKSAIGLLEAAIGKLKDNNPFKQQLRAQLEKLNGDKVALPGDAAGMIPGASDGLEGLSQAEQDRLDGLDAAILLAQIDTPDDLRDDRQRIQDKIDYLTGTLSTARSSGRSTKGIAAIAGALKSARDEMTSLSGSGSPGLSADDQAKSEQQMNRDRIIAQEGFINRLVGATMGGGQTLVFQSYVPPSPTEARRLADYTVGGIGYQGATTSSRESVGV